MRAKARDVSSMHYNSIKHARDVCTRTLSSFIKCPSTCARCDWSVRVHYNSIKYECIRHARALSSYNARCLRQEL